METRIITGDSLQVLRTMEDESIDCIITSPPYYGLRDYGTAKWEGGDPNCPHYRTSKYSENTATGHKAMMEKGHAVGDAIYKTVCPLCGAVRIDDQIGLEETPEEYIEHLVTVFREARRVLKKDGTLWLNIGDSYAGGAGRWGGDKNMSAKQTSNNGSIGQIPVTQKWSHETIRQKKLIGIPWMLAFALRADGWYLRQDIIWQKPNPMPESVKDRCTKSHEYIFLLSKSPKYYFDYEAIKEPRTAKEKGESRTYRGGVYTNGNTFNNSAKIERTSHGNKPASSDLRNKRDVWNIAIKPYKGAHFATFPEALVEPCLLAGCPEGGTALDPFSGAGTVGVVCKKKGRNYVGIELNPEYAQLQADRIASTNVVEETDKDEEQIPGQMNLDEFNIAN